MSDDKLFAYLRRVNALVTQHLQESNTRKYLRPLDIHSGVTCYLDRPAKRLRPAILMMACGCVREDGDDTIAVPAAAGIELFHTWSLVHDDIIDNDSIRRGQPTVHQVVSEHSQSEFLLDSQAALNYGRNIAILAGDIQHGWSACCFLDCALKSQSVNPWVIIHLLHKLESEVVCNLLEGEAEDVRFSLTLDIESLDLDRIIHMLWLKTGALYRFCGLAGALIGKNITDFEDQEACDIAEFASNCGTAFQFQDDLLGILGDEKSLGKPVGSDIREGKKTPIVFEALKNSNSTQRNRLLSTLGNRNASSSEIAEATRLLMDLGGIAKVEQLAKDAIIRAEEHLARLSPSKYKDLLLSWANYLINRSF